MWVCTSRRPFSTRVKNVAYEILGDRLLPALDVFLQGPAFLVVHDHVNGLVGAEEVQHAHHVGVRELGERPSFLEEALHATVAEGAGMLGGDVRRDFAFAAQGQAVGQVFLSATRRPSPSTAGKTMENRRAKLPLDAVFVDLVPGGKGVVGLLRHSGEGYHVVFRTFSGFGLRL